MPQHGVVRLALAALLAVTLVQHGSAARELQTRVVGSASAAQSAALRALASSQSVPADAVEARFGGTADWETGTVTIPGDDPQVYLYVAHRAGMHWTAAIEGDRDFAPIAAQARITLAGSPSADLLATTATTTADKSSSGSGAAELSLPWTAGQTWRLTGGPHSNTGRGRPWSSLDFAGATPGQSVKVRAARGGVVVRPCRNMVQIRHPGGWATSYYHLRNIKVRQGQSVARGAALGWTSMEAGCGGSATGPHLHFALLRYGKYVNIRGTAIGGWVVREGRTQYLGCLVRRSKAHCAPNGRLFNFGSIGAATT